MGIEPFGVAITPNGTFAYVTGNTADNTVMEITDVTHAWEHKHRYGLRLWLVTGFF